MNECGIIFYDVEMVIKLFLASNTALLVTSHFIIPSQTILCYQYFQKHDQNNQESGYSYGCFLSFSYNLIMFCLFLENIFFSSQGSPYVINKIQK